LCLATCRAFGGATGDALDTAVAIEMLHNGFLVHDDIQDGSGWRRGEPTLHVQHGVPMALLAGDALGVLSFGPLLANIATLGERLALSVMLEFHHLARRTVEGQAIELGWRREGRFDIAPRDYLMMVLAKTCWYSTIHPCRLGALIGSRGTADLDAFNRFGFLFGAAFQIHDDIESAMHRSGSDGAAGGEDVLEGKPTLLLAHVLSAATPHERNEIVGLVGPVGEGPAGERVARVLELMERHGSIDYARALAAALAGAALAEMNVAFGQCPASPDLEYLRALVLYLTT
jgi:geranylgeranyl diphosphate synthase type II